MGKRIVFAFLVVAVLAIALAGCGGTVPVGGTTSPSTSPSASPGAASKTVKAYDANDVLLGYCTESNGTGMTIYSPESYFYMLQWDGNLVDSRVAFTRPSGAGIPMMFCNDTVANCFQARTVTRAGSGIYVFDKVNPDGTAGNDGTFATYVSAYDPIAGTVINYPSDQIIGSGIVVFPLYARSRADVGIPATIATPIKLSFD
jgi:hypothetical protein